MSSPTPIHFKSVDVNEAAAAIAAGGRLVGTVEPDGLNSTRVTFVIEGIPADFSTLIATEPVMVNVRTMLRAIADLLPIVAASRRRRDVRR